MSLIKQLADTVGFHSSYTGTFGDQVIAKDAASGALLQAMGFKLDDVSLAKSIALLEQSQWLNILPSVQVLKLEEQQHNITVSLVKNAHQSLNWKIIPELGNSSAGALTGSVNINDLQIIDETVLETRKYCQYQLPLPLLEQGYYQLIIFTGALEAHSKLIYAPKTCYSPQEIGHGVT